MTCGPPFGQFSARMLLVSLVAVSFGAGTGDRHAQAMQAQDASAPVESESSAVQIVDLKPGLAGTFKIGFWTAFEIAIQAGDSPAVGRVEMTVLDGDGVPSRVMGPPREAISIAAGERKSVVLYAKVGSISSDIIVSFREHDGAVSSHTYSADDPRFVGRLSSTRPMVVSIGGGLLPADVAQLAERQIVVAAIEQVDQLPSDWWGYEGVDTVIIGAHEEEIARVLSAQSPQIQALEQWITLGGKAVLSVAGRADAILGAGSPLAAFAPGHFEGMVPLRQSIAFETFAETSEPLGATGGFLLEVPRLSGARGRVDAYAGSSARDLPLIVRTQHGLGQITYAAFDLAKPPFANWAARNQLVNKLLEVSSSEAREETSGLGQVTTLGFDDLAGQLRGALDQFGGVQLVPFWLVALLITAYIACIGPLDYLLVKRVFGRMESTWVTFAVTVLVFAGGAYALAVSLKGTEIRVNRVEIVDHDSESQVVRGTDFATVFSPDVTAFDFAFIRPHDGEQSQPGVRDPSSSAPRNMLISWQGLSGAGFGGMDATTTPVRLFDRPYDFSPNLDALESVPIAKWSTKALVGRWWAQHASGVQAQLRETTRLQGTIANNDRAPLENCVLFYERWAYLLPTLQPGRTLDMGSVDPQRVETYLRHVTVQGDRNVSTPYNRASFDVGRIVEIMSAHELAGGEKYTGLSHRDLAFLDLSRLVNTGAAVLIGRSPTATARFQAQPAPAAEDSGFEWCFHRYVFPVSNEPGP
ncbi:MAG TPA: hypothetical protein VL175_13895 [Pirellulales bacterium]|jgi:hypothetical protein|nr:hypothetical protein [Pirellulales bacterium]